MNRAGTRTIVGLLSAPAMGLLAAAAPGGCGPTKEQLASLKPAILAPQTINVDPSRSTAPSFYVHHNDRDVMLLFKPDDLVAQLRAILALLRQKGQSYPAQQLEGLLARIQSDLPLRGPTDLLTYRLWRLDWEWHIDSVLADLMKQGKVTVDQTPFRSPNDGGLNDSRDPKTIELIVQAWDHSEIARWFCAVTQ
jgi:hypothetical protein